LRQASVHSIIWPVNAILNDAYTVVESEVRIKAISDGYDPTIGIMYKGRDRSSKFIFDLMEPERPNIDRAIVEFLKAEKLHPADFTNAVGEACGGARCRLEITVTPEFDRLRHSA